ARVALPENGSEHLAERDAPLPRWQTVERLARLEPRARHVAVLDVGDLRERNVVKRRRRRARAAEVIGFEQESHGGMRRLRQQLASHLERVELRGLAVELECHPHAGGARDVTDLAHALAGACDLAAAAIGGAHDESASELDGPATALGEGGQELLALVAIGEHPAELHADARDRQAVRRDALDHLSRRVTLGGRTGKVDSSKLDRVPAGGACDRQELGERGRVESPRVQGQVRHGGNLARRTIATMSARVTGTRSMLTPNGASASSSAWAISGCTGMMPPSPAPFAPSGLSGDGDSGCWIANVAGASVAVASAYSMSVAVRSWPFRSYTSCRFNASGTPCTTPPWICPSTIAGSSTVPQSWATTHR